MNGISQQTAQNILVVGDIVLDRYWFGGVSRISPEAPVPVVLIKQVDDRLGGAANVADNISALGGNVSLMGVVGGDAAGKKIAELARQRNIATHFSTDKNLTTTVKLRVLGNHQQLLRIDFEEGLDPAVVEHQFLMFDAALPSAAIVVLSDYHEGALIEVGNMISKARMQGKIVLVDPKGNDYSRYAGASIVVPNRSELARVVGAWHDEADLAAKAQALRAERHWEALLLTRSGEGMTLFTENNVMHVPTQMREVYDVSGAGDMVIATLAAMLAEHRPLQEAVALANRAASIVAGKIGAATISRDELFQGLS